jgi:hypothetical protein
MRVCTAGEGSWSDLGTGGSGNGAGGGEKELYIIRRASGEWRALDGASAGKEGDMGRSERADRGRWETGGLDVV